jgi:hypothetical protein
VKVNPKMQMEARQNFVSDSAVTTVYKHRQKGGLGLYLTGFLTLLSVAALCYVLGMITVPGAVFMLLILVLVIAIFIWSTLSMSSMTVTVDNEFVRVVFGPHAFVKKFALKDITACKLVKNGFWDNWGIHMCGSGWLYNIAGFDAVEITFVSGRQNRIGTDQPRELAEAIQKAIGKFSSVKGDI